MTARLRSSALVVVGLCAFFALQGCSNSGSATTSPVGPTSPAPAASPTEVSVSGNLRDALNGDTLTFGTIERVQAGNLSGEKVQQGACASCGWSSAHFDFKVTAGKSFTLTTNVAGFISQIRQLTLSDAATINFDLVPLPVRIQLNVIDISVGGGNQFLRCLPARIEFVDGPNSGRVASLASGTQLYVDNLIPTDTTVMVSAPAYASTQKLLKIRPDADYPEGPGFTLSLKRADNQPRDAKINCAS